MADPKSDSPKVVQQYRIRVRTSDGRELLSHVATVTRPAAQESAASQPQESAASQPQEAIAPESAASLPESAASQPQETIAPQQETLAPQSEAAPEIQSQPAVAQQQPAPHVTLPTVDVAVKKILVSVRGRVQGPFKSDGVKADLAGKAPVHQFEADEVAFSVSENIDVVTGQPAGRRMYVPLSFFKKTGPATIGFQQALATSETLPEVILDCFGDDALGKTVLAGSVKLTSARVASIDFEMPDLLEPGSGPRGEKIALLFDGIELDEKGGSFTDRWS